MGTNLVPGNLPRLTDRRPGRGNGNRSEVWDFALRATTPHAGFKVNPIEVVHFSSFLNANSNDLGIHYYKCMIVSNAKYSTI